ncbi:MAG TPA: ABC transporter substrate-binding protein [Stellaceae bacterium]|nr:ABC transporter substrate-binding protein [Stellaceae bacterium]
MTRRAVLTGVAAAFAPVAQAQQRNSMRRLGVLLGFPDIPLTRLRSGALVEGLGVLGWKEGVNLHIDLRWASADVAVIERDAAELIALGPDLLFAGGSSTAVEALRRQTGTIPIVFAFVADPVGQGFVASLAHPGGTITGFSNFDAPMAGKWLAMLTQITPPVARAAVLFNPATAPYASLMLRALEDTATSLAVSVRAAPCRDDSEIEAMIAGLAREEHGGVLVLPDVFATVHRATIATLAARYRLPAIYPYRDFITQGGLMSYGIDDIDLYRRAATYVDRILKGDKPGDLPVQRPTKFALVINLKTAKALGVTIAPSLLTTADEVIE